jgi:hypothetical protein
MFILSFFRVGYQCFSTETFGIIKFSSLVKTDKTKIRILFQIKPNLSTLMT